MRAPAIIEVGVRPIDARDSLTASQDRGRLRDEFLNETLFTSLMQARLALEDWRRDYNAVRPHSPTTAIRTF
jgi:transposase InsO family protein